MHEVFVPTPVFEADAPLIVHLAGVSYCDGSYKIVRSNSTVTCFEYIISGKGTINKKTPLFPCGGDTYFLPCGEDHEYFSDKDDPWVKIWINVSGALVSSLIDIYSLRKQNVYHCNTENYFRRIHEILASKEYSPAEISSKVSIIFYELILYLAASSNNEKCISTDAKVIKNYIDKNIFKQITIEELSVLVYKSKAHTIRLFKEAYGVTPYKYYTDYRIKKAKSLLRDTNFSVKEIAFMMGFCDEHYFSFFFKKHTSLTPKEYIKSV